MIMNMSRKRSPRKKRFEFCHRPIFEWWSIPFVLVTIVILTESNATSLALQNNTENRENSVRDITKLQHEHKKEMNVVFNESTINFTALPEHKTHQNNVASGIINKLVNVEPNLVRFPAITATRTNVIGDKMAASERIIKDKNNSTDNTASDSIVMLKVNASSVGYVQLSNVTQLNENSINNVEKLQNTTQIIQKQTFSNAAISVPCPYKLLGSNTQNCENVEMNFNNTGEAAKNHKKRLIDDLNSEDYVVNDIEVVKNGVKVDFNYSKEGGINANVAQKNSEVLNINVHNDVKTSSEGQGNNVNNLVKLSDGQNAKSFVQNSGGRNNSVSDSGDKNNEANNSVRNSDNQNNNNDKNIVSNNSVRNNFDTSSGGNKISVNDFVTSGVNNISFNNFVTDSAGPNESTNNTFISSSGRHNNSVNNFVINSGDNKVSVNDVVTNSGDQNSGGNYFVKSFDSQNKTIRNNYVSSSGSHNGSANYFETSLGMQNKSIYNSVQNAGSQNNSANNFLNNYSVRERTNAYLYSGQESIKNFPNSSGSRNISVNNFVTSSSSQNNTFNNFVTRSGSHNNGVNNFVTSSGSHNKSVNDFVNSAGQKNIVQSVFTSSGGQNKSVVMKNVRVRTFKGHKNETHVKAGQGYVLLEDEKDEYEASIDHELDEYDRTTIRAKSPEPEAISGFFGSIQKLTEGVLESLAERIIPKGLRDILKRMQDQNTALETLRLRSKEENGGLGAFGRSLLKGLTDPLTQWVGGTGDRGSLDSDRGFLSGLLSGVADSMGDAFKIKVTAIYPGTLWCGDGHVAEAQSAEVGLFFMTDNCCRRHDSCRLYILAGESDYGLTNTGLFTRSHCSCDSAFYRCLKRTNTLVSSQIGATFFSILGPQCFKREHPIVKCVRRTRITGQKCEEYEVDKTQPKIWQWFDSPTF